MSDFIEYVRSGNNDIAMIFNEPANSERLVLILHSFSAGKNGNTERQLAQELDSRGISSVRFDFTGIEDSKSDFSNHTVSKCIEDTLAVYEFGKNKGYQDIAIYGFSLGGNVALNTVIKHQELFSKFALNAPAINIPNVFEAYGVEFMNQWKKNGSFPYTNQMNNITYNVNYNFYNDAKKNIITFSMVKQLIIPGFIIHGTEDEVVPYEGSVALFSNLGKHISLYLEENATHGLDVLPKGKELSKEDMLCGTYRQKSTIAFGDFLAE